jgi:hypothetical protein
MRLALASLLLIMCGFCATGAVCGALLGRWDRTWNPALSAVVYAVAGHRLMCERTKV